MIVRRAEVATAEGSVSDDSLGRNAGVWGVALSECGGQGSGGDIEGSGGKCSKSRAGRGMVKRGGCWWRAVTRGTYLANIGWMVIFLSIYLLTPYYKSFLASETRAALVSMAVGYMLLSPMFYIIRTYKGKRDNTRRGDRKCGLVGGGLENYGDAGANDDVNRSGDRGKGGDGGKGGYGDRECGGSAAGSWMDSSGKENMDEDGANKAILAFRYFVSLGGYIRRGEVIAKRERVAVLFTAVKFFFVPLMINFLFSNLTGLKNTPVSSTFAFALIALFTVDTLIFAVGYLVEGRRLNNVVRSVEPTVLGWAVVLVCYPPFNWMVGKYVPWGANDLAVYPAEWLTVTVRAVLILLLVVYVWASVSLGFKASNLTNRGIVLRGAYKYVRHPAYAAKVMFWWLTLIPAMSWPFFWGMLFWSGIYYLRAITEESHLGADPAYREYVTRVRYRFIPKIF